MNTLKTPKVTSFNVQHLEKLVSTTTKLKTVETFIKHLRTSIATVKTLSRKNRSNVYVIPSIFSREKNTIYNYVIS